LLKCIIATNKSTVWDKFNEQKKEENSRSLVLQYEMSKERKKYARNVQNWQKRMNAMYGFYSDYTATITTTTTTV